MPHWFIVEDAYPVRVSDDGMDAVAIRRDGTEVPIDAYEAAIDGHEVTEAEAKGFWAEADRLWEEHKKKCVT